MKGKRILVISQSPSHPQNSGDRSRVYSLLSNIKKLGHEIHFVFEYRSGSHTHMERADIKAMKKSWDRVYVISPIWGNLEYKIKETLLSIDYNLSERLFSEMYGLVKNMRMFASGKSAASVSDEFLHGSHNINKFVKKLLEREKFDVVIVEWVYLSKALDLFADDTIKIIDTHDCISGRNRGYLKGDDKYGWADCNRKEASIEIESSCTPESEAKALERADIIIAIQDKEKEIFSKMVNKRVVTIGHILEPHKPIRRLTGRKNMLFVGTNCPKNIHAISNFIRYVFPKVRKDFPEARMIIAGNVSRSVKDSDGITKLGEVMDIEKAYAISDIVISPMFLGAGLKIKNIAAMAHAKPLITTTIGAEGLDKAKNKALLLADNPKEFARAVRKLFSNKRFYERISKNEYDFIRKYNKENINAIKELLALKR